MACAAAGLIVLVALGGSLRWLAAGAAFPVQLVGDEAYYVSVATNLARGHGHVDGAYQARAGWPPAHPWLLSFAADPTLHQPVTQASLRPLIRMQVALGTLVVALCAILAGQLLGARAGVAAGALAAIDPTLVAFSHCLWAENLLLVLGLAGLCLGVAAARRRRAGLAAAAGVAFGLATLTREVGLALALACAAWSVAAAGAGQRRGALGRAALLLAVALLVVAPWTLRNARVLGRFVPVSTVTWMALREGNTWRPEAWWRIDHAGLRAFRRDHFAEPDEVARMDRTRADALARIAAEQPGWLPRKVVRTGKLLFEPDSFLLYKLSLGSYGELAPRARHALVAAALGSWLFVGAAGLAGLVAARGRRGLALACGAALVGVHLLANASSRYRLPLLPFFLAYAGFALAHPAQLRAALRGRRAWLAALLLVAFLGLSLPFLLEDVPSLWSQGTYANPDVF